MASGMSSLLHMRQTLTPPTLLLRQLFIASGDPQPAPATAIIVAHPDDEVVGVGARLPRLRQAAFIHVTDGAPRDLHDATAAGFATRLDYARARRRELTAALAHAGIGPEQTRELGCTDQEAALQLVHLSRRVAAMLRKLQPEVVITLPYEGGHPDHDATAFAVHAACRLLESQHIPPPALIEITAYHNSATGIEVCDFLPSSGCETTTLVLSEAERDFKRCLFDCFPTQRRTLSLFPIAIERFRPAPRYRFTQPPHEGSLFYEHFPWGMTGVRFRSLARQAMAAMGIAGAI
jgi:N-acetylglucosamine malate deacetylase 2